MRFKSLMKASFIMAATLASVDAVKAAVITQCTVNNFQNALATEPAGGTIDFQCAADTILQPGAPITINKNLTIRSTGALVEFNGAGLHEMFRVDPGVQFNLEHLKVKDAHNGNAMDNDQRGGAIFNDGGVVNVTEVFFDQNSAPEGGGAIYNNGGTVTVERSSFLANTANSGGCGGSITSHNGLVKITNSSFAAGSAARGAHLCVVSEMVPSQAQVNNSTFSTGSSGGGLGFGVLLANMNGALRIQNSILANYSAQLAPLCEGVISDEGFNIQHSGSADPTHANCLSANSSNTLDPLIGTGPDANGNSGGVQFTNFDGFAPAFELPINSPAVDAGNQDGCRRLDNPVGPVISEDQRNWPRPFDGNGIVNPQDPRCDIGAFELQNHCGDTIVDAQFGEQCDLGLALNGAVNSGCSIDCQIVNYCGDSQVAGAEQCDLGAQNGVVNSSCSIDCQIVNYCGDSQVAGTEQCDLGAQNGVVNSGCSATCQRVNYCGDGQVGGTEQCDVAGQNGAPYSGCSDTCTTVNYCGDGAQSATEECDLGADMNGSVGSGCSIDCHWINLCGDGIVAGGEQCDLGSLNDISGVNGCFVNCTFAWPVGNLCGNESLDEGEECDDGNHWNQDGCSSSCQIICGDGFRGAGEECDDGNANDSDACSNLCRLNQPLNVSPTCGNAVQDLGEECDDANMIETDGCTSGCTITAVCGNSIHELGEQCDDGNDNTFDTCVDCRATPDGSLDLNAEGSGTSCSLLNSPLSWESPFSNVVLLVFSAMILLFVRKKKQSV